MVDESAGASDRLFPEGFTLLAAAVLGAVIVLAGVLLWEPDGGIDAAGGPTSAAPATTAGPAPSTSSPPTTAPPAPTAPGSSTPDATAPDGGAAGEGADEGPDDPGRPGCPANVDPVICDAVSFVEAVRGRPFQSFPEVEVLADNEFVAALLAGFDQVRDQLDGQGVTLQALGLLAPDVSLADAYREAVEVGVVGFYDPRTDRLVVRAGPGGAGPEFGLYEQQVLVHELVHAFDDQWFGLDRDFPDQEAEYGFAAVVEGNARRVDQQWRAGLDPADQARLQQEELDVLGAGDLLRYFSLPPVLQELQLSPYVDGAAYVAQLVERGGEAAVDAALAGPPATSEEILSPSVPRTADPEISLPPPAADGAVADEGRLGKLLVRIWLGPAAAEGWGGGRFRSWRDGEQSCTAVYLAGDTPADLAEMRAAGERWAAGDPGDRTVGDGPSTAGTPTLELAGCAG